MAKSTTDVETVTPFVMTRSSVVPRVSGALYKLCQIECIDQCQKVSCMQVFRVIYVNVEIT